MLQARGTQPHLGVAQGFSTRPALHFCDHRLWAANNKQDMGSRLQ